MFKMVMGELIFPHNKLKEKYGKRRKNNINRYTGNFERNIKSSKTTFKR